MRKNPHQSKLSSRENMRRQAENRRERAQLRAAIFDDEDQRVQKAVNFMTNHERNHWARGGYKRSAALKFLAIKEEIRRRGGVSLAEYRELVAQP